MPDLDIRNPRLSKRWSVKELKSRETMWSFKSQATLQADAFSATWNDFLGRASMKEGDIYRTFAAMQDFKASLFREVPDELRMRAILKGNAFLPPDLFFSGAIGTSATSEHTGNNAGSGWVPSLPSGRPVDCQVGYLRMHTDYSVVQSCRIQSLLVRLEGRAPNNFSVRVGSGAHAKQVFIEHGQCDAERREHIPHHRQEMSDPLHCILFPDDSAGLRIAAVWYNRGGALFEVVSLNAKTVHLSYRHAVQVLAYNKYNSAQSPQVILTGESLSQDCQILIDCGQYSPQKMPLVTSSVVPRP